MINFCSLYDLFFIKLCTWPDIDFPKVCWCWDVLWTRDIKNRVWCSVPPPQTEREKSKCIVTLKDSRGTVRLCYGFPHWWLWMDDRKKNVRHFFNVSLPLQYSELYNDLRNTRSHFLCIIVFRCIRFILFDIIFGCFYNLLACCEWDQHCPLVEFFDHQFEEVQRKSYNF